ncbi:MULTISPECIES: hypothetical protein [Oxalobacteraceae]|uniref:hypothetical protein n=1 Tax=Oxalobacteraceae TaxID=75682 RepID=UPI0010A2D0FD|nr:MULTISPECIES: hypothetical protein [Oxalobacteraceae]HJV79202.1 hypothetical protein [Noviherbaspirillum sp.]
MRGFNSKYRDYENGASLKALMTARPMTTEQYSAVIQKRIEQRRKLETAKELRAEAEENPWW